MGSGHMLFRTGVALGLDLFQATETSHVCPVMQVAESGSLYVMMHSRGDSQTMQDPENTSYLDLEADIAQELNASAASAMAEGVCAWNIILDPGIGFAKTARQSAQLLRNLPGLRRHLEGPPLFLSVRRAFVRWKQVLSFGSNSHEKNIQGCQEIQTCFPQMSDPVVSISSKADL